MEDSISGSLEAQKAPSYVCGNFTLWTLPIFTASQGKGIWTTSLVQTYVAGFLFVFCFYK